MVSLWFPLTVSTLALSCNAFHLPPRSTYARRDGEPSQNFDNFVLTNPEQNLFFSPTKFGSFETASIVSTAFGDILLPSQYADNLIGFTDKGRSTATGNIISGAVSVAGWSVPDQDIVLYTTDPQVKPDTVWPLDPHGAFAYLGFGTNKQSAVYSQFNDSSGETFIAHVAAESPDNRYYTLLLQPDVSELGTDQVFGGIITINEIVDLATLFNLTASELQGFPDLTEVTAYPYLQFNGNAEIIIEGLVGPNGPIHLTSNSAVPPGNTTAYIDSTQPSILVNADVAQSFYSSIPGAQFLTGRWHVPCTELNATWTIAGKQYPMSPLTMVSPVNESSCVGTFQPKADANTGDIVLGVPFLKNVYALFGYTTWESSGTNTGGVVSDPYIKLLPVTDPSCNHDDWVNAGWDSGHPSPGGASWNTNSISQSLPTTSNLKPATSTPVSSPPTSISSPTNTLTTTTSASSPAASPDGKEDVSGLLAGSDSSSTNGSDKIFLGNNVRDWLYHCLPAIVVGAAFVVLILVGLGIWTCIRRKRGPDGKGSYKTLHEGTAASAVHVPLYGAEEGRSRYTDPYKD